VLNKAGSKSDNYVRIRQVKKKCHKMLNITSTVQTNHNNSTSSCVGAATLTARHRLRIAGMTRVDELQHRMRRHVPQYFSIVRLRACCASFVNRSTSVNNTTAFAHHIHYPLRASDKSKCCVNSVFFISNRTE